jgi:hypothetical protein
VHHLGTPEIAEKVPKPANRNRQGEKNNGKIPERHFSLLEEVN